MSQLKVTWQDGKRQAKCPPDPRWPDGIHLDNTRGYAILSCKTDLPYPAPQCGRWLIECDACGQKVIVTAAGRVDDPRSIKLVCQARTLLQPGAGNA